MVELTPLVIVIVFCIFAFLKMYHIHQVGKKELEEIRNEREEIRKEREETCKQAILDAERGHRVHKNIMAEIEYIKRKVAERHQTGV